MADHIADALEDRITYTLPDGTTVTAGMVTDGTEVSGWALYTPEELEYYHLADYEVDSDGAILFLGEPTGWSVRDLTKSEQQMETASWPRTTRP